MNTKYNYVFFAIDKDYYRVTYHDLNGRSNIRIIWNEVDTHSRILNLLNRVHFSTRVNKAVKLPLKSLWFRFYYKNSFMTNKPICFVFFGRKAAKCGSAYLDYLKMRYPNCKIVITFLDLVKATLSENELIKLQNSADLVFSYDLGDAEKYNMVYQHDVFSKYPVEENLSIESCDIYFLGKAKDRLDDIIESYDIFTSKGLKCDFYITGVDDRDTIEREGVHYLRQNMSYIENLQHVNSAKSLLEILQNGAKGSTLRCCEAIAYDKILITNNKGVSSEPFYSKDCIKLFSATDALNQFEFCDITNDVHFNYAEKLSPLAFIERLETML